MTAFAMISPNGLTVARIVLAPFVAFTMALEIIGCPRGVPMAIFVIGALTDYADGALARAQKRSSRFGTLLDPIADKILVLTGIFVLTADGTVQGWTLCPALLIVWREVLISGLREIGGPLNAVPSQPLARLKTVVQYVALALLFASRAAISPEITSQIGVVLLWLAATLSLYTFLAYIRRVPKSWM